MTLPSPAVDPDVVDERSRTRYERARDRHYRWADYRASAIATLATWTLGATGAITLGGTSVIWWIRSDAGSALLATVLALPLSAWIIHLLRHVRDLTPIRLPPVPPPACTFFSSDLYLGSGWTDQGAQGGDWLLPTDHVLEPHVAIPAKGVFAHLLIDGQPGSGKSELIRKVLAQCIRQWPLPPAVPRAPDGRWYPIPAWDSDETTRIRRYTRSWRRVLPPTVRRHIDRGLGGPWRVDAALDPFVVAAYGGLTTEHAALARHAELLRNHRERRPTVLVLNAKSEGLGNSLADFARRAAAADSEERLAQVDIISPELGTSIAAFDLNRTNADLGDSIRTSIEIIEGRGDPYWAGRATALLTHLIAVLRVVAPGRVNWTEILRVCGNREYFRSRLAEAKHLFETQTTLDAGGRARDAELPRIDFNALLALSRYEDLSEDEWLRLTSRITDFGRYILSGDLTRMMAPEVPTSTWAEILTEGRVVIVDMPFSRYGNVARAISTLMLNAFINQATDYGARTPEAHRRPSFVFVDEVPEYASPELERNVALVRAASVGFVFGLQTHAQLERATDTMRASFLTACGNKVSYRDPDGHAATVKSATYGTREEWCYDYGLTEGLNDGPSTEAPTRSRRSTQTGSVRITRRDVPRFKPEMIMHGLSTGRAIAAVTDGQRNLPPRIITTERVNAVPWLADLDNTPVAPYIPPLPLVVLADGHPTPVALDRLHYLVEFEDPTRDETLTLAPVYDGGQVWGILVWTNRFAFVLDAAHIPHARSLLARAFAGGIKAGHTAPLGPAPLVFTTLDAAVVVADALALDFRRACPLDRAILQFPVLSADLVTELHAAIALAPGTRAALLGATHAERRQASNALRIIVDAYRRLDRAMSDEQRILRVAAELQWIADIQARRRMPSLSPSSPSGAGQPAPSISPGASSPVADRPGATINDTWTALTALLDALTASTGTYKPPTPIGDARDQTS